EAIKTYQLALDVAPGDMNLHLNLAHALLISGRMEEGWAEFEHRLADPAIAAIIENAPGKDWHGEPLDGQSILLLCEQGLGDAIQFCRAIPELKSKGAEVHLAGPARMERLMSSIEGLAGFHAAGGAMPKTDFHCPLVSLSHRAKYAIQVSAQAYLTAEPERVALWAARLEHPEGPKIGIAWQGNSAYGTDYARSIPLKQLARLTGRTDAHFVVLQHGPGRDQLPALAGEIPLIDFGDDVDGDAAFVDTAAIMANLDLIITSDTAIPHLAAALGRPVWMLLPFAPDWRWLLDRSDSPHYASMRLFRQTSPMDWGSALDQARRSLDLWLGSGGDPNAAADQMLGGG
ncbi:MAG: hypothetical protein HQ503_00605, partial [Rhodospirillales bacterium]|nr:hypothetical protein [Rhodospirillales bacterium]